MLDFMVMCLRIIGRCFANVLSNNGASSALYALEKDMDTDDLAETLSSPPDPSSKAYLKINGCAGTVTRKKALSYCVKILAGFIDEHDHYHPCSKDY